MRGTKSPVASKSYATGTCKDRDENGVQLLYFIIIIAIYGTVIVDLEI